MVHKNFGHVSGTFDLDQKCILETAFGILWFALWSSLFLKVHKTDSCMNVDEQENGGGRISNEKLETSQENNEACL